MLDFLDSGFPKDDETKRKGEIFLVDNHKCPDDCQLDYEHCFISPHLYFLLEH